MTTYTLIPEEIMLAASKDRYLVGEVTADADRRRVAIYCDDEIVGFMTPEITTYKGKRYHRTGSIYVLPKHRRKGLASKAVMAFFEGKKYGLAYVETTNLASMRTFEKAGFVKEKEIRGTKTGEVFNLMLKRPEIKPSYMHW